MEEVKEIEPTSRQSDLSYNQSSLSKSESKEESISRSSSVVSSSSREMNHSSLPSS